MNVCLTLVTAPNVDEAAKIARMVVEERLAACGNIVPQLRSIYRWEGEVLDEAEVLILFKTTRDKFEPLKQRVLALHPYQVPEVICVDVADGHAPYLAWVLASVRGAGTP